MFSGLRGQPLDWLQDVAEGTRAEVLWVLVLCLGLFTCARLSGMVPEGRDGPVPAASCLGPK